MSVALVLVSATVCMADDAVGEKPSIQRRMLICCGLPGDDDHRQKMTTACQKLILASQSVLGVEPGDLRVLAGDQQMVDTLSSDHSAVQLCQRETIQSELEQAGKQLGPNDGYWVILIGHAHPYGVESQLNIAGPDINQQDFARWTDAIRCREQVYWMTQPISGFWIKPLAREGRIVISATEADLEFTGTEMPYALADVMTGDAENQVLEDIDGDSVLSLLDLYLATNLEVASRFRAIDRLQTEHGQLDDNGDGRGSEVQEPYLPAKPEETDDEEADDEDAEAEDAEAQVKDATVITKPALIESRNLDGYRSRFVPVSAAQATDSN
ncbi:hypothetical protein NHH03_11830 [Stieleria sp. TO1_6]|uniref:hypothetical protein n=1 Tax=Stieleria tagensis TaxID=2956795 RepID=UPI00209B29B1|nr:hypothetical protein [Stieleria tagensis]MCO8122427.1 hypothetical protein [Stieleria tagensis]